MAKVVLTGSEAGLGKEIKKQLLMDGHDVWAYDSKLGFDVMYPDSLLDEFNPDILINCAGVNKINWLENVTDADWDHVNNVNVKGIFKMTQACLSALIRNKGTVLNIVSNAAHMPMRCSAAYNASKGAALILTKQLARELTSKGITVFSVSPNKLHGTEMSDSIDEQVVATRGWTKEQAQAYQLQGLLTGEETPPEAVAEFIAFLLQDKEHHKYLSGCDLPYGA